MSRALILEREQTVSPRTLTFGPRKQYSSHCGQQVLTRTSKWACDWQAAPRPLVQVGSVPESASQNKGNAKRWSWTVAEIQQGCEVLEISKRARDLCGSGQQAQALGIYGAPRLVSIFFNHRCRCGADGESSGHFNCTFWSTHERLQMLPLPKAFFTLSPSPEHQGQA